jgi:acyl-CoA synthetase (AMP-forming)/AMP-acid ligase II
MPDRLAYRFLRGDAGSDSLTFGQLNRRVRGLAARLRERAAPGDCALLLYPPGLGFIEGFLGCLAAGGAKGIGSLILSSVLESTPDTSSQRGQ